MKTCVWHWARVWTTTDATVLVLALTGNCPQTQPAGTSLPHPLDPLDGSLHPFWAALTPPCSSTVWESVSGSWGCRLSSQCIRVSGVPWDRDNNSNQTCWWRAGTVPLGDSATSSHWFPASDIMSHAWDFKSWHCSLRWLGQDYPILCHLPSMVVSGPLSIHRLSRVLAGMK